MQTSQSKWVNHNVKTNSSQKLELKKKNGYVNAFLPWINISAKIINLQRIVKKANNNCTNRISLLF